MTERDPMIAEFWNLVDRDRTGNGCWRWTGPAAARGYGGFSGGPRFSQYAHRTAWQLLRGPIPDGMCVWHRCPDRRCVNPGHLYLAPRQPTLKERVAQRRAAGEQNPGAKLDEAQVRAIRAQLRRGRRQRDIAADFGVSQPLVSSIATGRLWRSVA